MSQLQSTNDFSETQDQILSMICHYRSPFISNGTSVALPCYYYSINWEQLNFGWNSGKRIFCGKSGRSGKRRLLTTPMKLTSPPLKAYIAWTWDVTCWWSQVLSKFFRSLHTFHPFHKSSCCHHGAKFYAASTNHFHLLHKSSCCKHHPAPPDYGMPPWDLPPHSAALYGEATSCWYFPPPNPPLSSSYYLGDCVAASLVGRRLRPVPLCMGIFSFSGSGWFHFSCVETEQKDCPNHSVMVNFYEDKFLQNTFILWQTVLVLFSFSVSVSLFRFCFSLKQIFVFAFL